MLGGIRHDFFLIGVRFLIGTRDYIYIYTQREGGKEVICSCIESLLLCEGNTRQGCVVALCSTVRMHVRLSWQELGKWLFVAPCQQKTHIWSSQTMLTFLDFMAEELRARRRELNLDISHKAMIICDMASQHSAKKFAALKRAWVEQHNAVPGLYLSALLVYIYI